MTPNLRRLLLIALLLVLLLLLALYVWPWGDACRPAPPVPPRPDTTAPAADVRTTPEDAAAPRPDALAVTHPDDPVQIEVTPVLPRRTDRGQEDGHRRFFEVQLRYHAAADGDGRVGAVTIPDDAVDVRPGLVDACLSDRFAVAFSPTYFPVEGPLGERFERVPDLVDDVLRTAANGPKREWWFDKPDRDGQPLRVRPAALCELIETLRESVRKGLELDEREYAGLVVTRVCPAQALAALPPTDSMLRWHVERLGAKASAAPPGGPFVDVALVDSGVADAVPDIVHAPGPVAPGGPPETRLAHGTAMALLIRQLLPPSLGRITSYRVFDAEKHATPAQVAQAIDLALHDGSRPAGRPLVINLSLGWPPELSALRLLSVVPRVQDLPIQGCRTFEGPVGEEVRYMLAAAREADAAGRPVLAVASIGNRTGEPDRWPELYRSDDLGYAPQPAGDPCNPSVRVAWFFPAEWARVGACHREGGVITPSVSVVVAAGATDPHPAERQAVPSVVGADPPLVAPGEHVYAALYDDSGAVVPLDEGPFAFPSAWSGTSVGAALTSAVAARAQADRARAGAPPLRWVELERLLWLTGRDLGRASLLPGVGVRRVDACRLGEALSLASLIGGEAPPAAGACKDLLACAGGLTSEAALSAAVVAECQPPAAACLAATTCGAGDPLLPTLPDDALTVGGPVLVPVAGDGQATEVCLTASCPYDGTPDAYSLGDVTPLPFGDGCNDCFGKLAAAKTMTFRFNLNPKLAPGSQWTDAWVEYVNPAGSKASVQLAPYLTGSGGFDPWLPGYSTTIEKVKHDIFPSSAAELKGAKAVLVSIIEPEGARPYRDESPLYLESALP